MKKAWKLGAVEDTADDGGYASGDRKRGAEEPADAEEADAGPMKKKWAAVAQEEAPVELTPLAPLAADDARLREWVASTKQEEQAAARLKNTTARAAVLGFKYIETNKMYRAPVQLDYEDEPECPCARKGRACDDGRCTNRAALQECLPTRCSSACRNQRFQRREWIEFALAKRGRMGYGVVALQDVDEGDFIMEYVGEVIDEEEKAERLRDVSARHHYTMQLGRGEYLDPAQYGNFGRFLNHSCDPNCHVQQWEVAGEKRMGFFALRAIAKGTDLTFDYQFERQGNVAQRCLCGSANCRGWIGAKSRRKRGADESDGESEEPVEEQSFDEYEDDDVLGIGDTLCVPYAPMQHLAPLAADDAGCFAVTLDLLPSLMRSAARLVARPQTALTRRFLSRNLLSGLATFHRVLETDTPLATILRENTRPRRAASVLRGSAAERRATVEALLAQAKN